MARSCAGTPLTTTPLTFGLALAATAVGSGCALVPDALVDAAEPPGPVRVGVGLVASAALAFAVLRASGHRLGLPGGIGLSPLRLRRPRHAGGSRRRRGPAWSDVLDLDTDLEALSALVGSRPLPDDRPVSDRDVSQRSVIGRTVLDRSVGDGPVGEPPVGDPVAGGVAGDPAPPLFDGTDPGPGGDVAVGWVSVPSGGSLPAPADGPLVGYDGPAPSQPAVDAPAGAGLGPLADPATAPAPLPVRATARRSAARPGPGPGDGEAGEGPAGRFVIPPGALRWADDGRGAAEDRPGRFVIPPGALRWADDGRDAAQGPADRFVIPPGVLRWTDHGIPTPEPGPDRWVVPAGALDWPADDRAPDDRAPDAAPDRVGDEPPAAGRH